MRNSTITAYFETDVQRLWNAVTDNTNWHWRSDLANLVQEEEGKTFTEYAKGGFSTVFTITAKDPCHTYAFTMHNQIMTGLWQGDFYSTAEGKTKIVFTEWIEVKNPILRLLSYVFFNLKRQQRIYVRDLGEYLGCSFHQM